MPAKKRRNKYNVDAVEFCRTWCEVHRRGGTVRDVGHALRMPANVATQRAFHYRKLLRTVGVLLPRLNPVSTHRFKRLPVADIAAAVVGVTATAAKKEFLG